MSPFRTDEKGTTLVSVLVAMLLLAVIAYLLAGTISKATQTRKAADALTTASFLAFQKEQEIMGESFNSVASETRTLVDTNKYPGFYRSVSVMPQTDQNVIKVTVTVTYSVQGTPGGQKTLVFYRTIDQPLN